MSARRFPGLSYCLVALCFAESASAAVDLPSGTKLEKVDFERHVMGLFGKAGCNAGSCHGSFQGKGGFRLSLFGYDPAKDFAALTRDIQGRRIDTVKPDDSLLLLKATGQMRHEGGTRFGKDSWHYQIFREWIAPGRLAPRAGARSSISRSIRRNTSFSKSARREDASDRRRSPTARPKTSRPSATSASRRRRRSRVDHWARSRALQPGDTGFIVLYRGKVASARPGADEGRGSRVSGRGQLHRPRGLRQAQELNMVPSDLADDAEFLRRVTIDTIGTLPTPDEVRAFLADKSAEKREKKIDELLKPPCTRPCGRPSSATSPATTPMAWSTRRHAAEAQPDVARLVPQAHRREHALRRDRPRHPVRHQPRGPEAGGMAGADQEDRRRSRQGRHYRVRRSAKRSTCSGGGSSRCRSSSGARRRRPRSSAFVWNAPSATSTRSTAGRRPITGPSPTSSPASSFAGKARSHRPGPKKLVDAENAERTKAAKGKKGKQVVTDPRDVRSRRGRQAQGGLLTDPDTNKPC